MARTTMRNTEANRAAIYHAREASGARKRELTEASIALRLDQSVRIVTLTLNLVAKMRRGAGNAVTPSSPRE